MTDAEAQELVHEVERELESLDDRSLPAVQALVALYGEALRRLVAGADPLDDVLVSHLLLAHDLHPVDVMTRVERALEEVRPYLGSHGGDIELLSVDGGIARLRLKGSCDGCAASAVTLRHAVETAVLRAAPELEGVEAEEPAPQLLQIRRAAPGPCLPEAVT